MDIFQTPDTLSELSGRPQRPKENDKIAELKLEGKEPQVLSCKWVDGQGVTLGVYFSWSKMLKMEPKGKDQEGESEGTEQPQAISKV